MPLGLRAKVIWNKERKRGSIQFYSSFTQWDRTINFLICNLIQILENMEEPDSTEGSAQLLYFSNHLLVTELLGDILRD